MIIFLAVVLIAAGIFSIAGAICNWDWFMDDIASIPIVAVFGRDGARVIYGIFGVILIVLAVLLIIFLC